MKENIIFIAEVEKRVGRDRQTIKRRVKDPNSNFPTPVMIDGKYAWRESQIDAYIDGLFGIAGTGREAG